MDFYLTSIDQNRHLQFPLNPERITANTGARVLSFETIALGEIAIPKGKKAARISWEGIFPGETRQTLGINMTWAPPTSFVDQLQRWRDGGERLQLLVTETPLNLEVYIDTFEHSYSGGHGDISYRLDLVQARDYRVYTLDEAPRTVVSSTNTRSSPAAPQTYMVRTGDTLWGIAKQTLQDGSRWREIYSANQSTIGPNPDLILPGQTLRIPGGTGAAV